MHTLDSFSLAIMLLLIAGSCVSAGFTSCCDSSSPISCRIPSGDFICYCDQACYSANDCCFDIQDVACFPGEFACIIISFEHALRYIAAARLFLNGHIPYHTSDLFNLLLHTV